MSATAGPLELSLFKETYTAVNDFYSSGRAAAKRGPLSRRGKPKRRVAGAPQSAAVAEGPSLSAADVEEDGLGLVLAAAERRVNKRPSPPTEENEEEEETVWSRVAKNYRKLTSAEKKARNAQKESKESLVARQRADVMAELGGNVDEGLLSLLAGGERDRGVAESPAVPGDDLFGASTTNDAEIDFFSPATNVRDEEYTLQIHEGHSLVPFSGAYKYTKAKKWPQKDLDTFMSAIQMFGADLQLVHSLLPHYTQTELGRKFRALSRADSAKMKAAWQSKKTVTTEEFVKLNGEIDSSTHYTMPTNLEIAELTTTNLHSSAFVNETSISTCVYDFGTSSDCGTNSDTVKRPKGEMQSLEEPPLPLAADEIPDDFFSM